MNNVLPLPPTTKDIVVFAQTRLDVFDVSLSITTKKAKLHIKPWRLNIVSRMFSSLDNAHEYDMW